MRISWHGGHPKTAFIIKGHLHRIRQIWELLFASKHLNLVAFRHGQGLDGFIAIEILGAAVFDTWHIVGWHLGQLVCLAVIDGEIGLFGGGDFVDKGVTQSGHFAGLFDFIGIVLRSIGIVALAVRVNAIDEVVVAVPEVIFLLHSRIDELRVGFGDA